ncbi:uncharacterized protein LOC123008895 [Tribolium madens]|uniref:uncharacterized protein LOC123008895 n=1 Tax=Tribolium madens TaxID=41895 RepID=UPI001CF75E63|nr:uncharacterized protein LOC123008895 [Tribolium madens]
MKFCLFVVLFGVFTISMSMALNGYTVEERIQNGNNDAAARKDQNILGLKGSTEQLAEVKYKKVLDLLRQYLIGLQKLPKVEFGDLSDLDKLEKALENKDVKHLIELLKDFLVGVQKLQETPGKATTDAKPAAAKPAAEAKPASPK